MAEHKAREREIRESEEAAHVEIEKLKAKNETLVEELKEEKAKISALERVCESDSELEIKKELSTFETLLQCEETRLGKIYQESS